MHESPKYREDPYLEEIEYNGQPEAEYEEFVKQFLAETQECENPIPFKKLQDFLLLLSYRTYTACLKHMTS